MSGRALGERQEACLRSLREFGCWHRRGSWTWDTDSGTTRIMESLVRRGLVVKRHEGRGTVYYPTKEDAP